VNVSYPYFVLCLFAASFHSAGDETFFWGLCPLLAWALWSHRSRRFRVAVWAGALAAAIVLGYAGQRGIGRVYRLLENYNARWFIRGVGGGGDPMQSKTSLGQIGLLKGSSKIVIRLEPRDGSRAPSLLREASYRTWKGQTWYSDISLDKFDNVYEQTNQTTWVLVPGKTNSAAVNLACYLHKGNDLLPLPAGSGQLENLSAYLLQKSGMGAVLAGGPELVVFDALYGPGPTIDSPADTVPDTYVLPKETNALEQVIEELQLKQQSRREVLHTLSAFFQDPDKFRYSTWQGPEKLKSTNGTAVSRFLLAFFQDQDKVRYRTWQKQEKLSSTNETPLARFLLRTRSGHCEYFATATVLLLRQLGFPARYAVGYAVHEASGRKYVVRQRDAHAWCLVWNPTSRTWQDFDTTPASWVAAEAGRASWMQSLSDCWSRIVFEVAKFRWGQTHLRQYLLWGVTPILALLLYQIIFRSRRRRHQPKPGDAGAKADWPGLDSEFYRVERKLIERGAMRQPGEPLSTWLLRASADPAFADMRSRLQELLQLHYRYRFDPDGLSQTDREALRSEAAGCLARLT
jgi:hypothetical protein